jgi:hypothetical protein
MPKPKPASTPSQTPSAAFVVGADTAERLFGPKYYGDDELRMHVALALVYRFDVAKLTARA